MRSNDGTLSAQDLELLRKDFSSNPAYRLAQNAVTRVAVDDVAINREIVNATDHSLSTLLDDWKVTNQERSGRCWLFAGLNLLRVGAMKKMGLKDFEFSQNYAMFWDKIERANYFLEAVIETADRDIDDRTVAFLLSEVAGDGGQWNMFVAIVNKHGLVPKAFMPETQSSSNTGRMNSVLRNLLRQGAKSVREASAQGPDAARAEKADILRGRLPGALHPPRHPAGADSTGSGPTRTGSSTATACSRPRSSRPSTSTLPINDYVCLVHDPRPTSPVGQTFTVEYLGNVLGAPPVTYLNVDMR